SPGDKDTVPLPEVAQGRSANGSHRESCIIANGDGDADRLRGDAWGIRVYGGEGIRHLHFGTPKDDIPNHAPALTGGQDSVVLGEIDVNVRFGPVRINHGQEGIGVRVIEAHRTGNLQPRIRTETDA